MSSLDGVKSAAYRDQPRHCGVESGALISVCYTSARPGLVPARVQDWIDNASDAEAIEFVVTIDETHAEHQDALARLPRTRLFVNRGRPCCVDGWNLAV